MRFDAAALTRVREDRGWTRRELARRAGVSPATITRLENGEHRGPLLSTIVHVAQALDVTTEELLAE